MLNSKVRLTKIPTSKYACVSVGILKGRGQLLDRLHDHSCCTILHSDVLKMDLPLL